MKKIFTIIGIFLLAAGCAKTQPIVSVVPTPTPKTVSSPAPTQVATPSTANEAWKTYKNITYGFQFQYPPEEELNLNVIDKSGSKYYDSSYNDLALRDSEIDALNKDVDLTSGKLIMVSVYEIAYAFPKNLIQACQDQNRPVSDGVKCLNSGGDAGPGATQDFLFSEGTALTKAKAGEDFNYFSSSPTQSQPYQYEFKKIIGTVIRVGSHNIYVYAVPDSQALGLQMDILAFNNSGSMIQLYYNAGQFYADHPGVDYSNVKASDVTSSPDWQTIKKIASSLQIND